MQSDRDVDVVILGAGSAGCVLANRLSEDPSRNVLVLEAGPMDHKLLIHIPAGVYSVYRDPSINWNYLAEAEASCADRQIDLPRGKVIGGSSSINSMVYMRGHPHDYDAWAHEHGLPGWSYADCLPYFRKCESSDRGENMWRGGHGPLGVTQGSLDNPLIDALLLAGEQSGQGRSDDLNGYNPEGIARLDSTTRNGRRSSAAVAHLKPALTRPNLALETRALVNRILIENGETTGVEYVRRGKVHTVRAPSVIVCCGAIKTPQLLMLSGIGPADHLREHGVEVVVDSPGVGQNLQDHLAIINGYACTQAVSINTLTNPIRKLAVGAQWLATRKGLAASNIWETGGMIRSNTSVTRANIQYHFTPVYSEYSGRKLRLVQGLQLNSDQLRPRSRGHVSLRSANPQDGPMSRFNYLSDPHDLRELVEAHRAMTDILSQPAFDPFRGERLEPAPDVKSDREVEQWIRATTSTDYHPCGTCRMGSDERSVVDTEFYVRGVAGLRVVDASVMPTIVSGNLNAPTQMIAERAADTIRGRRALDPEHASFTFSGG